MVQLLEFEVFERVGGLILVFNFICTPMRVCTNKKRQNWRSEQHQTAKIVHSPAPSQPSAELGLRDSSAGSFAVRITFRIIVYGQRDVFEPWTPIFANLEVLCALSRNLDQQTDTKKKYLK